jgi:hypothetical protein
MPTTTAAAIRPIPVRTQRRRRTSRLAAVGAAAALAAVGVGTAAPAQAMERVCMSWSYGSRGYIDSQGNDWVEITARCTMWLGGDPADGGEPKDDGGAIPPGAGGGGTEVKPGSDEYCEMVKRDLESARLALAGAQAQLQAAEDDVDKWNFVASGDHADYEKARAEYDRTIAVLDHVTAMYAAENDTATEREVKSGVTISRSLPVNPFLPWGPEVLAAQQQMDRARATMQRAWSTWSQSSDPAAHAAQDRLDAIRQTIMTAPGRIEDLQRDLHDNC